MAAHRLAKKSPRSRVLNSRPRGWIWLAMLCDLVCRAPRGSRHLAVGVQWQLMLPLLLHRPISKPCRPDDVTLCTRFSGMNGARARSGIVGLVQCAAMTASLIQHRLVWGNGSDLGLELGQWVQCSGYGTEAVGLIQCAQGQGQGSGPSPGHMGSKGWTLLPCMFYGYRNMPLKGTAWVFDSSTLLL